MNTMQVETFETEEINSSDAATMAADSEAIELCQKLGLKGQSRMTNTDTATRNPYRLITAEERAVYQTCFPNKTKLEEYADAAIPLRVLQVAANAKESGFFQGFIVWHPNAGQKDPVLIGLRETPMKSGTFEWSRTEEFILARWGEGLLSLEQLKVKARTILVADWTKRLTKAKSEITTALEIVGPTADDMLNGGESKGSPHFSW